MNRESIDLMLLAGSATMPLTRAMAATLAIKPAARTIERFPDGELHVRLDESVRGADVFIVQTLSPPAESHLLEMLFLADACRRAGADRITAVIPYLAYARQDRRAKGREALGARIIADTLATARFHRAIMIDVHVTSIEGFCQFPVEQLTAVPLLADAIRSAVPERAVIVAPDARSVRLAQQYALRLDLPVAAIQKLRVSGTEVRAVAVAGDVAGRAPIIVDDMISTGRTVQAAADALLAAGCLPTFVVAATHGLFVGGAVDTLPQISIERLITTDTLPQDEQRPLPLQVISVAPLLAEAVKRLHDGRSMTGLLAHE